MAREDTLGRFALAVVLTGAFVAMMDTFVVNVAVPSIRADLGANEAEAELVVAGYTLTYAVGLIMGGRLGDAYGRRRMFLLGMAGFTGSSLACGLAPTPGALVAGRLVQGAAAAVLSPQVLAVIRVTFAEGARRARAFAAFGVAVGLASVLGQILGAAVVAADLFGLAWRPIFLLNVPLGVAVLLACPLVVRESRAAGSAGGPPRLDWSGAALGTTGLGLLLLPLVAGRQSGWPPWSLGMLAGSAVVLAIFVRQQAGKTAAGVSPLLDTRLLADPAFRLGAVVMLLFSATMPPLYLGYTMLLQTGFGAGALAAGLYFAPLALAFSLVSFVAGRVRRVSAGAMLVAGAVLHTLAGVLAALVCLAAPGWLPGGLLPAMILFGLGEGLFFTPILNVILSAVAERHAGVAAGVLSTMQRLGNSLGVAVLMAPFLAGGFAALAGCVAGLSLAAALLLGPLNRRYRAASSSMQSA